MRFSYSSVALFAGTSLAASPLDCLTSQSGDLAAYADCANTDSLTSCLSSLQSSDDAAIVECYTAAGCSQEQAEAETKLTLTRCDEFSNSGELRKRYAEAPLPTLMPRKERKAGDRFSSDDCFTTKKKSTTDCPIETKDGKTTTGKCSDVVVTTSDCAPDVLCTRDAAGTDICMVKRDMDTGGIIIAIVFAAALAIGMGALGFYCCKDRKQQKRLAAKAEAVALARAATKKKRAEQRQPLIRNQSGGSNPFQDQPRA